MDPTPAPRPIQQPLLGERIALVRSPEFEFNLPQELPLLFAKCGSFQITPDQSHLRLRCYYTFQESMIIRHRLGQILQFA